LLWQYAYKLPMNVRASVKPNIPIGGTVGATATTAHWLAKHRSATLPAGTELTLELNRALTMGAPPVVAPASGGSN
jgi:hypothetical protein